MKGEIKIECRTCINRAIPDMCQTCISSDLNATGIELYRKWAPKLDAFGKPKEEKQNDCKTCEFEDTNCAIQPCRECTMTIRNGPFSKWTPKIKEAPSVLKKIDPCKDCKYQLRDSVNEPCGSCMHGLGAFNNFDRGSEVGFHRYTPGKSSIVIDRNGDITPKQKTELERGPGSVTLAVQIDDKIHILEEIPIGPKKPSWSETAFELMDVIAKRSDDPHTHVGAVIMDTAHRIVSIGYNGFPRGVEHKPERTTRENGTKYLFMVHAEQNAILFADRERLKGAALYVPLSPCAHGCAQAIIQSGITSVYVDAAFQREYSARAGSNYTRDFQAVREMFQEAGVNYVEIERRKD